MVAPHPAPDGSGAWTNLSDADYDSFNAGIPAPATPAATSSDIVSPAFGGTLGESRPLPAWSDRPASSRRVLAKGCGTEPPARSRVSAAWPPEPTAWRRAPMRDSRPGTHPSRTRSQSASSRSVVGAASSAWNNVSTAYQQAAAQRNSTGFVGNLVGQGSILAMTAIIPGGAEAEAVEAVGDLGRAAEVAGEASASASGETHIIGANTNIADAVSGVSGGGTVENAADTAAVGPTGKAYSVAYQMTLDPASYPGLSREFYLQKANGSLLSAMEGDPEFAQSMQDLGVNLQRTPTGLAPRNSPADWTWHHAEDPGVM